MDYQEQILAFLEKPENLPIALEVAKHVETLRPRLHKAFWQALGTDIQTRLESSSFKDNWAISNSGDFDHQYKNMRIYVKSIPDSFKDPYLTVCIMQERPIDNYRLIYGLSWGRKERSIPNSEAFRILLEQSKSTGFSEKNQNTWWPTFAYLNISLRNDEFMLQYGLNPTGYIDELAERFWAYFKTLEPKLLQLNQELFEGKA